MSKKTAQADQMQSEQEIAQAEFERSQIDNFIQAQIRDSKRLRFIVFRQERCLVARTILAGSLQRVAVRGLNHDKMSFDDLEKELQKEPLIIGNQVFQSGRRVPVNKSEYLILENPQNSDVDRCVVVNVDKTQLFIGFNISNAIINYDIEAQRVVTEAQPLFSITLKQPPKPKPIAMFNFEDESLKNTPMFYFGNYQMERANNNPIDPTKSEYVAMVTMNPHELQFQWYCQQCYAMTKRYETLTLFVLIYGMTPQNMQDILAMSPFLKNLNLVYDYQRISPLSRFYSYLTKGSSGNYQLELETDDIDTFYEKLQQLLQSDRALEEDNELIVGKDGQGITFMGIDLQFCNPDQKPQEAPAKKDDSDQKKYKRVKDNAISNERIEKDDEPDGEDNGGGAEPEMGDDQEAQDEGGDEEQKKDPLNTYVVAFWNPRHRDFQACFKDYLTLVQDPKLLNNDNQVQEQSADAGKSAYEQIAQSGVSGTGDEAPTEQPPADEQLSEEKGETKPPQTEEFQPHVRLYCCIQGTRQINISGYKSKLDFWDHSKLILDNDWLFNKIKEIFNDSLTRRNREQDQDDTMIGKSENPELDARDLYNREPVDPDLYTPDKVGFFYMYNSKFKNIMETTSYPELRELVILRRPVKKATAKQDDE